MRDNKFNYKLMFKDVSNMPDKQIKSNNDLTVQEMTDCKFYTYYILIVKLMFNNN